MPRKLVAAFLIFFIAASQKAGSQIVSAPSLAVGLSGLVGEKGNIDVELLTEIISQKQEELKKEGLRRVMNHAVISHSYAMWDFTSHSLEMLLYTKDKKAIEKELAEYATNMVLVYGFSEAYLQASYQLGNSHLMGLMKKYPYAANMDSAEWNFYLDTLKKYTDPSTSTILKLQLKPGKLFWLSRLKRANSKDGQCCRKDSVINFNTFFLDLVYDVLRENKNIRDLGFFSEAEHISSDIYKSKNQFYIVANKYKNDPVLTAYCDSLKNRVSEELSLFIKNYYILKVTYNQGLSLTSILGTLTNVSVTQSLRGMYANDSISPTFVDSLRANEIEHLLRVSEDIASKVRTGSVTLSPGKTDSIARELNNCINFFRHIKATANENLTNEDLLFVREKAMPLYLELNMIYGIGQSYLGDLRKVLNYIYAKNVSRIKKEIDSAKYNPFLNAVPLNRFYDFVSLLTELHKLDKANTYDYVFNTIKNVSAVLPDGKAKTYLSVLTDNIERFAFINKDENKIEIDVEEILLQLYKRFSEQNDHAVKFYLSIGLNQTLDIQYKSDEYKLSESNDENAGALKSLAFASEKVGVKVSLLPSRKFARGAISSREKKLEFNKNIPFISDFHIMAFGSGILYNIVNTKTSKNFTYPLAGLGAGLSFYNGLDVNLFYASPVLSGEKFSESISRRQLVGFSLDIKFLEYIEALRKKRAEQKSNQ